MKLTSRGRFTVTAMIDLALNGQAGRLVRIAAISERQKISQSYLEQLFAKLRRAGLVQSMRGPGGGYRLARPAQKITIAEIVSAVEDRLDATRCRGAGNCKNGTPCIAHHLWQNLNQTIDNYLSSITLADVLRDCPHDILEKPQKSTKP